MESVSLLGTLGVWVAAHPLQALLAAVALPLLATVVSELLPKARALPPQEPAAEALPTATDAEPTAAVREPVPVAGPQPTTEPAAAPVLEPTPVRAPEVRPRARLRDRLKLTSDALVGRLGGVLSGRKVDAEVLDELEMLLMSADLGVRSADGLLEMVRSRAGGGDAEAVRDLLREAILEKLPVQRLVVPDDLSEHMGPPRRFNP